MRLLGRLLFRLGLRLVLLVWPLALIAAVIAYLRLAA